MANSTYKPSQDEIIYEFKYAFPKGTWNRIEEIIGIFLSVVSLLSVLLLWSIADVMKQNIIVFVLYHCACVIVLFSILHILFVAPRGEILLSHKGMYIKGTHRFLLWNKQRFYKYGDFGVRIDSYSLGLTNRVWVFTIYNIHKKYSFFARDTASFTIAENNEIQDMREFLALLREKTQEALEAQGKAECYNLKEKIQHKHRKDF